LNRPGRLQVKVESCESALPPTRGVLRIAFFLLLGLVLTWLLREIASTTLLWRDRSRQVILFYLSFAVFIAAVIQFRPDGIRFRGSRWLLAIIAFGIIFRLAVLPSRSILTTDINRYVWEGRLVSLGINPYTYTPDDPRLEPLRDEFHSRTTYKSLTTIYPPFSQIVFGLIYRLKGDDALAFKTAFVFFDIGTCLLLPGLLAAFGYSPLHAIIYLWHPLAIIELSARGHQDAVGIFFLVLALRLAAASSPRLRIWAASALCASLLAKGYSLFALPFFFLREPRKRAFAVLLLASAAAFTLPFLTAGRGLVATLFRYVQEWQGNTSIFWLLDFALRPVTENHLSLARLICALAFLAFWSGRLRLAATRKNQALPIDLFWILCAFFLLSPIVYPWYLVWTLPLACFVRSPAWLLLSGTVFGFYANKIFAARELWWITLLQYALPFALAVRGVLGSTRKRASFLACPEM